MCKLSHYSLLSQFNSWRSTELESQVEFAMSVIRTVRSMRADYQLTKTKTNCRCFLWFAHRLTCGASSLLVVFAVYLKCSDDESADILRSLDDLITVLGSALEVRVITDDTAPQGCAILTVSAKCEVHMMLKVSGDLEFLDLFRV